MGFLGNLFGNKDKVKSYYLRDGALVEADERRKALNSGDLDRMLKQLYKKGDPVDTHFIYLQLIGQAYSRRNEPEMRMLFKKLANEHVEKFDPIREQLIKEIGILPRVPTFQYLATVYTEDNEYEKAIDVCEKAIAFGLNDGTKGGYQGRIERIKKKAK
jgi:tetratricopeptide (TPR) repeat protein